MLDSQASTPSSPEITCSVASLIMPPFHFAVSWHELGLYVLEAILAAFHHSVKHTLSSPTLICPSSLLPRRVAVASIKILDQTYTLPAIATERFRALQNQVENSNRSSKQVCVRSPAYWV